MLFYPVLPFQPGPSRAHARAHARTHAERTTNGRSFHLRARAARFLPWPLSALLRGVGLGAALSPFHHWATEALCLSIALPEGSAARTWRRQLRRWRRRKAREARERAARNKGALAPLAGGTSAQPGGQGSRRRASSAGARAAAPTPPRSPHSKPPAGSAKGVAKSPPKPAPRHRVQSLGDSVAPTATATGASGDARVAAAAREGHVAKWARMWILVYSVAEMMRARAG